MYVVLVWVRQTARVYISVPGLMKTVNPDRVLNENEYSTWCTWHYGLPVTSLQPLALRKLRQGHILLLAVYIFLYFLHLTTWFIRRVYITVSPAWKKRAPPFFFNHFASCCCDLRAWQGIKTKLLSPTILGWTLYFVQFEPTWRRAPLQMCSFLFWQKARIDYMPFYLLLLLLLYYYY